MDKKIFTTPIIKANPITVLVLGICSALAVTVKLEPAIVMGISVTLVTGLSSFLISLIRKTIPNRIRIIVQLVVVAMFVILISEFLKAYVYDVSKQLSVYVGLIITNCIIMGRIEAFGLTEKPLPSLVDGLASGNPSEFLRGRLHEQRTVHHAAYGFDTYRMPYLDSEKHSERG